MPAPAPCQWRACGAGALDARAALRLRTDAAASVWADADALPLDPRLWTRSDVGAWAARRGARPERFPMNGKALCLMSDAMFAAREPGLGPALYREFRRRLGKALALQQLLDALAAQ